jgi:hypothetical protein
MVSSEQLRTAAKYGGVFTAGAIFDRYLLDPILGRARNYLEKRAEMNGRRNAEYTVQLLQKRGILSTQEQFEKKMYKAIIDLTTKVNALEKKVRK